MRGGKAVSKKITYMAGIKSAGQEAGLRDGY